MRYRTWADHQLFFLNRLERKSIVQVSRKCSSRVLKKPDSERYLSVKKGHDLEIEFDFDFWIFFYRDSIDKD